MIADRFDRGPACSHSNSSKHHGVLSEMRVRENPTQALRVTEGCTENKLLVRTIDNGRLQRPVDAWDVANRWIAQNAAMSLLIAATMGATWGWIQKRSR